MSKFAHVQALYDALQLAGPAVPGVPHAVSFLADKPGRHIVFGTMVHGDETGSLPAAVTLARELASGSQPFVGRVTLFVGNPAAGLHGVRFMEADLNRVFVDNAADTLEHRRSIELRRILDTADLFIDFHQTIEPTDSPFYIFPWSADGEAWVRALGAAPRWVTRAPGQSFSAGTCCADEYVRHRGRPALTVELSQQGIRPEAERLALKTMRRTLSVTQRSLPLDGPLPSCLQTAFSQRFTDPAMRLRAGLRNFEAVSKGDVLSPPHTPALICPCDGLLLFPKYPPRDTHGHATSPRPGEIYRVLRPIDGPPAAHYRPGES